MVSFDCISPSFLSLPHAKGLITSQLISQFSTFPESKDWILKTADCWLSAFYSQVWIPRNFALICRGDTFSSNSISPTASCPPPFLPRAPPPPPEPPPTFRPFIIRLQRPAFPSALPIRDTRTTSIIMILLPTSVLILLQDVNHLKRI
jgi:hypothetical protein